MSMKTSLGLWAVGAMIALLPLSNGCATGGDTVADSGDGGDGGGTPPPVVTPGQNATFLVTNGTFFDSPGRAAGATTANLTDTAPAAFVDTEGNIGNHGQAGPSTATTDGFFSSIGATEVFGDPSGKRIEVTRLVDIGNDGESGDGFLMVSHQDSPTEPGHLEIGAGFGGADASEVSVIKDLQARTNHTATYTGAGEYYAAIGNSITHNTGELSMQAHFSGADAGTVEGGIQAGGGHGIQTVLSGAPPVAHDRLAFHGKLNDDNAAYFTFDDIQLRNGGTSVTDLSKVGGAGAFFGKHAGGTVFTLSGTGTTTTGGHNVNVLGAGRASTTDNN